jgi:hypothetical protein
MAATDKSASSDTNAKKTDGPKIEGEGSYSAAKTYDDAVHNFVAKGKVAPAAAEAKRALDSSEGAELTEAEAKGKAHAAPEKSIKSKT